MKKKLACIIASAACSVAYSQSIVTLYGTIDDGFSYTSNSNGKSNYQMSNGALGSSKWGFLVKEDLGASYQAIAVLENGFDINSGKFNNGGRLFGRQAYVGVTGSAGQFVMGRLHDLVIDELLPLSAGVKFGGILATHAGDVDNVWGDWGLDNSVRYTTPLMGGVKASAQLGFGGVAGNFAQSRKMSYALDYAYRTFSAAAVISNIRNPATSIYDGTTAAARGQPFTDPITNPIFSGYVTARNMQTIGGAVSYGIWNASVGVNYTNTKFQNAVATSATTFNGSITFDNYEATATYRITPALLIGGSYDYTHTATARYNQINLGTQYFLSKTTLLYLVGAWQHAAGTDSTGRPAVAALTFVTPSSTGNQTVVRVGIRKNF